MNRSLKIQSALNPSSSWGPNLQHTHLNHSITPVRGERQPTIIEVCWLKVRGGGDRASQARDSHVTLPVLDLHWLCLYHKRQWTLSLFCGAAAASSLSSIYMLAHECCMQEAASMDEWLCVLSKEQERARILPELSVISVCSATDLHVCGGRDAFSLIMCSEGARIFFFKSHKDSMHFIKVCEHTFSPTYIVCSLRKGIA